MNRASRVVASLVHLPSSRSLTSGYWALPKGEKMSVRERRRREWKITLLGDLMLGRLIDQSLPQHVDEPGEARIVAGFRQSRPAIQNYTHSSPWGNSISLLKQSDLILGNLETSATTHAQKWPDKVFNYRMHPANVRCLQAANINYVSLANNHTLDFDRSGLLETVETLKKARIAFAGAGETEEEAQRPARLILPRGNKSDGPDEDNLEVHLYSFSDHPHDWLSVPEFNLMQYDSAFRSKMKTWLTAQHPGFSPSPALKIVSMHWGPNYAWHPDSHVVSMAHFLIDECDVDLIHGHSSHHIQGVETYRGKLIVYGCGDFVDDYALTPGYRNDLSAAWNVTVSKDETCSKLCPRKLEVFPNRIKDFQAGLLEKQEADHEWVRKTFTKLCEDFSTPVEPDLGPEGQIVVQIEHSKQ